MAITPEEFNLIRKFLLDHSGILINEGKEYLVENRLTVLLVQNGCENFVQLYQKLQSDSGPLRTKVVDAMTTNETLWFRDDSFFSAMSDFVVPELVRKAATQSSVRIWSAACSTGQEPYSIAMLIDDTVSRMGAKAPPLSRFSIHATDISPSALFIANSARYSQLAISRGMRKNFLDRYFTKIGMAFELNANVRSMVKFQSFNLKEPYTPFGTFDLILCRNVLIYFSDDLKRQIYGKLHQALNKDGLLAIGSSESPRGYTTAFTQVQMGGAVLFRPQESSLGAAPPPSTPLRDFPKQAGSVGP